MDEFFEKDPIQQANGKLEKNLIIEKEIQAKNGTNSEPEIHRKPIKISKDIS